MLLAVAFSSTADAATTRSFLSRGFGPLQEFTPNLAGYDTLRVGNGYNRAFATTDGMLTSTLRGTTRTVDTGLTDISSVDLFGTDRVLLTTTVPLPGALPVFAPAFAGFAFSSYVSFCFRSFTLSSFGVFLECLCPLFLDNARGDAVLGMVCIFVLFVICNN